MSVWRANPIPTQLNVGIAALLATSAAVFVPQAYPAQLMAVAGARASALPSQQRGLNPALIPASAPQFDPSLLGGTVHATRAAVAFYRPSFMPFQPAPLESELLDWYEADGAVGQAGVQEAVWAGYRAPTIPTQWKPLNPALIPTAAASLPPLPIPYPYAVFTRATAPTQAAPFNPALFPAVAPDAPPLQSPYPYAALWRTPAFLPQPVAAYNPAIDGPYQTPPFVPAQPPERGQQAHPAQASGFNAALIPGAQNQPGAQPYPYAALLKTQERTQAPAIFNPSLFIGPQVDTPPLASVASQPAPPFKAWILPVQNAPFNAAFLPPQVDDPPLSMPYPYSGVSRIAPHPTQAVVFCPALVPDAPPVPDVQPQGGGGGRKRKVKSWDQRERERLEEIARYAKPNSPAPAPVRDMEPYKRLDPATVRAYERLRTHDDDEAMAVIARLL